VGEVIALNYFAKFGAGVPSFNPPFDLLRASNDELKRGGKLSFP